MIRVLQLLTTMSVGGGPQQVYDLVRRLPREEFEVVVGGPRDGPFFERFRGLGVRVVEVATDRIRPPAATARLIRRSGIQVVHSHGKGAGFHGRLAARLTGAASVHTFHGIHYIQYSWAGRRAYLALERALGRLTHAVVNVAPSQAQESLALGLAEPARTVTIVNGIDAAALDAALAAPLARSRFGLGADRLVVGTVARFDPVKRLPLLVEAVRRAARSEPRLALLLVGSGPEETRLRRLAIERGLTDRVRFAGPLDQAARALPLLDLYAATSAKEGLPLALVEAMAARLAVVASDVPGHRDVVVHGETGVLVPADDPAALASALADLLGDAARRTRLGAAGRRRALTEFGVEPMVAQTAQLYRDVVKQTTA